MRQWNSKRGWSSRTKRSWTRRWQHQQHPSSRSSTCHLVLVAEQVGQAEQLH